MAKWDAPDTTWDDPEGDVVWDEDGLMEGILWANENGTWMRSDEVHPRGYKAGWKEPYEVWGRYGKLWYGSWPETFRPEYPTVENLVVTANTSTSINVAWDALAVTPIRYRITWEGGTLIESGGMDNGLLTTASKTGLTVDTQYTVTVWAEYPDGNSTFATLVASTGSATPPSLSAFTGLTYNSARVTVAGTAPFTLKCTGGSRNGQTFAWAATGQQTIGSCVGTEYWTVSNAGGTTSRFYTNDGTAAQSGTTGAIKVTLTAPVSGSRGSCAGISWGEPPMAAHANFPYSNCTNGSGAQRFQTGNYPKGWVQHSLAIPANYRIRRFMFVQGDGAGNQEMVTPVYSVDGGASFKRWSHFGGTWIAATDATINPSGTSPNGLLSIDSGGSWDRDWNWRLTTAATLTTPFIPENATNLSARTIYVRWGLVHLSGSFGANIGECWMEYQEPSTPAVAEVKCAIAWG